MTKTKTKLKTIRKQVNNDNAKTMMSFRVNMETHKQLSQIAQRKKASKTRVVSELIRLAYLGLYSKPSQVLNEFYNEVLKTFENKLKSFDSKLTQDERKALELKQRLNKHTKEYYKRNPEILKQLVNKNKQ